LDKDRVDAVIMQSSLPEKVTAALALKHRFPLVSTTKSAVEVGALMSYAGRLADSYREAAVYVDKILRGAKPADLPVQQPTKFELVINLKTAKALGPAVPQSILAWSASITRSVSRPASAKDARRARRLRSSTARAPRLLKKGLRA